MTTHTKPLHISAVATKKFWWSDNGIFVQMMIGLAAEHGEQARSVSYT
ncbi:hypothetical protein [Shimia sp.]